MIELGGLDAQEKDVVAGFKLAQDSINALVAFQEKIRAEIGKPKMEIALSDPEPTFKAAVTAFLAGKLESAIYHPSKEERDVALSTLKHELFLHVKELAEAQGKEANLKMTDFLLEEMINEVVHKNILEGENQPDGRKLDELRALSGEVALFSRTHGSALFTRGNTQALAMTTLAPPGAEQLIETMETQGKRRFLLHYNFPPFSVGEVGFFRGPGSARDRPWQSGAQVRRAPDADEGRIPVYGSRGFRNYVFERFVFHGDGLCDGIVLDGCRRADQETSSGHRDGADAGAIANRQSPIANL